MVVGGLLLILLVDYVLYPIRSTMGGTVPEGTENGLWLRYPWYFGRHSDAEIRDLGRRLTQDRSRFAYFHVRHVTAEGHIRYRFPREARRLIQVLRETAPEVVPVAWVFAGNNGAGGLPRVNLKDGTVRRRLAAEARWLVSDCGFAGVQWDYEICPDGDAGYPALLRDTRAALSDLPGEPLLGACTAVWGPIRWRAWSEEYFTRMAAECDQLAVMGYDTGLYLPRAYAWLMREQTVRVPKAAVKGNPDCRVLIGVPTYSRGGLSHHPWSENLEVALGGVREGVGDRRFTPEAFSGVALFADYTTQAEEWSAYRRLWIEPAASSSGPGPAFRKKLVSPSRSEHLP